MRRVVGVLLNVSAAVILTIIIYIYVQTPPEKKETDESYGSDPLVSCQNRLDDDGDGQIDLQDPDCKQYRVEVVVPRRDLSRGTLGSSDMVIEPVHKTAAALSFKITETSLSNLKSAGIPVDVLKKLAAVQERQIFSKTLERTIGEEATAKYKSLILKHAVVTPCHYYTDLTRLEGRFLCTDLYEDVPICKHHLGAGLACLTEVGMRAMSVKVDDVVGVAGFIKPGDRVDVLAASRESDLKAKIVLSRLRVLAIGSELERKENEKKPSKVTVITLEVNPQESQKLAFASGQGNLRLALRNPEDKDLPQTDSGTCVVYEGTQRKEVGC